MTTSLPFTDPRDERIAEIEAEVQRLRNIYTLSNPAEEAQIAYLEARVTSLLDGLTKILVADDLETAVNVAYRLLEDGE